ncbi:MAG: phosphatidate cytidylyltransferase, partial [Dehalococcoidia bacterium]|nr:phosphatidate cytidylyltransferase [Dehalococcoidia bacterium]
MKARLLSASIALPIVVGFIFLGGVWFSVLMIFGASIAGYEASRMLRLRGVNASPIVSSISSGIVVLLAFIFSKTDITAYLFSLCLIIGGVASIIWISSVRVKNSSKIVAITG